MKDKFEMKSRRRSAALAALLFAGTISANADAHQPEVQPYAMAVISNAAYGAKVESGRYEQAIDRITRNGSRMPDRFSEQVNLCVAYTKTRNIAKAGAACDAAIAKATELPDSRQNDADLALALSNRGVLMAVKGEHELAKRDFRGAIDLRTKLTSIATNNLERLGSKAES